MYGACGVNYGGNAGAYGYGGRFNEVGIIAIAILILIALGVIF